ncbi:TRAP transporter small permease [Oscillospiraceae bacterium LTW-04]|nr:TRAP transporter small permease [Oscillospiraceae bacterium MB24-C1]
MRTFIKNIDKTLAVLAALASLAFVGTVVIQIFSRTFLPKTPSWTEELARYFFIYSIAFAAGLAVRENSYVAVDILTSKIPRELKKYFQMIMNILMALFALFFEVKSVFKFAFLKVRMVSTALEIPMQYIYFALIILFGFLTFSYICEVILMLMGDERTGGQTS